MIHLYISVELSTANSLFEYHSLQIKSSIQSAGYQFDNFMFTISLPLSIILRQVCSVNYIFLEILIP